MVINDIRFKGKHFRENKESKHWRNAMYGWYRYDSRFAIPVYRDDEEVERYNIFHASLIVRYSEDGKLYLYDVIDIKKKRATRLSRKAVHDKKTISFYEGYEDEDEIVLYIETDEAIHIWEGYFDDIFDTPTL